MRFPLSLAVRLAGPAFRRPAFYQEAPGHAHRPQQIRAGFLTSVLRPDMAAFGAMVALFYSLFLFQGYTSFFRDSDAGWHIRTGETILQTASLPRSDPYSFTRQGQPWIDWEWGADALMGFVHQHSGLAGVAMFYGLVIAAGVWLWFRLNWDVGGNFLLACILASPMLSTCNLHWLARPHMISWLFFLLTVRFCEKLTGSWNGRQAIGIALLSAVWANVHGSFFFAAVIPLIWAIGTWLRTVIWDEPEKDLSRIRGYLGAAGVAIAASLLNPYGWKLHLHVAHYLLDRDLLDRIGEFQSFNFHAPGALPITLGVAIAMAGAVFSLARRRVEHFLLSFLLVTASLRSARGLPLVALIALPLANGAITESLAVARSLRPSLRRLIDRFLRYGLRLRTLDSRNSGAIPAIATAALCWGIMQAPGIVARTGFPTDQFPVAAAAAVAELPPDVRIFAPDKFGGYLIYKFNGSRKVFFDGRSDFYGAGFLKDYGQIVQVRPGWKSLFEPFRCSYALLPDNYSLLGVLQEQGWTRVYHDATATLLSSPAEARATKLSEMN